MQSPAPIVLFVFDRPEHALKTLTALKNNRLSGESELFIYADGPRTYSSDAQLARIQEVRTLIKSQQWCGKVNVIERESNLGLSASIITGISEVFKNSSRVIVLEDDQVTSPGFLTFMNDGLNMYENDHSVYGISGYSVQIKNFSGHHTYFSRKGTSWGWASYKRVWDKFEANTEQLIQQIEVRKLQAEFDLGGYPFFDMLKSHQKKQIDSWDICFYAYSFINDGLWLTPVNSLVSNIGFDGSGSHNQPEKFFSTKYLPSSVPVERINVMEDKAVRKQLEKIYHRNFHGGFLKQMRKRISALVK